MNLPIYALTPGDPEGIGPEITWKVLQEHYHRGQHQKFSILCVGAQEPFKKLGAKIVPYTPDQSVPDMNNGPAVWLLAAPHQAPGSQFLPGYQSGWSIEQATQLVLKGKAKALITGPISKDRLQKGGYPYPGHTEFLAHLSQTQEVTMMLANSHLRVSLVTTHVALGNVPKVLSPERITRAVHQTVQGLREFWKMRQPRIAILGLNPHCGESGLFGREEIELIEPVIQRLQKDLDSVATLSGPFPSDTFFAQQMLRPQAERFDAVIAMYHDQGLIPVKLLDFHRTVNITLGLPMVRTSVDHGVAFDIAGQGIANASSLQAALELAVQLTS